MLCFGSSGAVPLTCGELILLVVQDKTLSLSKVLFEDAKTGIERYGLLANLIRDEIQIHK
jgi:hypothetical protein